MQSFGFGKNYVLVQMEGRAFPVAGQVLRVGDDGAVFQHHTRERHPDEGAKSMSSRQFTHPKGPAMARKPCCGLL